MENMPIWLQYLGLTCVVAMVLKQLWPALFAQYEARRVAKNRASLTVAGLTPERYMATLNPTDYQLYAEAVFNFWPRRHQLDRQDSLLDNIARTVPGQQKTCAT